MKRSERHENQEEPMIRDLWARPLIVRQPSHSRYVNSGYRISHPRWENRTSYEVRLLMSVNVTALHTQCFDVGPSNKIEGRHEMRCVPVRRSQTHRRRPAQLVDRQRASEGVFTASAPIKRLHKARWRLLEDCEHPLSRAVDRRASGR